jgi:hypothetical protein
MGMIHFSITRIVEGGFALHEHNCRTGLRERLDHKEPRGNSSFEPELYVDRRGQICNLQHRQRGFLVRTAPTLQFDVAAL